MSKRNLDWLLPLSLIALSLIPVAAGTFRVVTLAGGARITPENARFFAAPAPVVLHIVTGPGGRGVQPHRRPHRLVDEPDVSSS